MKKKQGFASLSKKDLRVLSRSAGSVKHPNKGFGSLTPEKRTENASKAASARWAKVKQERLERDAHDEENKD